MKEIEIIPLAGKKMLRRRIKEEVIKEAIFNPDQIVEGYNRRSVAHKRLLVEGKERLLRVVYEETSSSFIVITAYLTSQIKRYWRENL